jgi:hypothetical protein
MGPFRTRAVTHLDITQEDMPVVVRALVEALTEVLASQGR